MIGNSSIVKLRPSLLRAWPLDDYAVQEGFYAYRIVVIQATSAIIWSVQHVCYSHKFKPYCKLCPFFYFPNIVPISFANVKTRGAMKLFDPESWPWNHLGIATQIAWGVSWYANASWLLMKICWGYPDMLLKSRITRWKTMDVSCKAQCDVQHRLHFDRAVRFSMQVSKHIHNKLSRVAIRSMQCRGSTALQCHSNSFGSTHL